MSPPQRQEACLNCTEKMDGAYCAHCGEPAVQEHDLAVRHLLREFVHEVTDFDGKMWRTVGALFVQPGRLTAEYWAGRRGKWVRPLRLYIVISTLTFLLASNAAGPLGLQVTVNTAGNYMVGQRPTVGHGYTPVDAETTHHVQAIYLWLRYLSLGIFAASSLAAYRKRQRYYGAHLVLALHFYSFEFAVSGILARAFRDPNPFIAMTIGCGYLFLSLRRIYGEQWWRTGLKSLFLFGAVAVSEGLIIAGCVAAAASIWKR